MLDALAPEFRPEHAGLSPADVNELEEVDLCNETLVRAHGPGLPRGDGRARGPAAPHDAVARACFGLRLGVAAAEPAVGVPPDALCEARRQGEAPHAQGVRPPPLLSYYRRDPTPFVKSPQ